MKKRTLLFAGLLLLIGGLAASCGLSEKKITMTILYDNYIFKEGMRSDWGFSCLIEGFEKTILFDTGTSGDILFQNIDILNVDIHCVDLVVLSHIHNDHTGGLSAVLEKKHDVSVYFPISFPDHFSQEIRDQQATPIPVDEPIGICEHVYSTGEIEGSVNEQSLILDTDEGLVVITGCSHPGIVTILKRVKEILDKPIYLVFGGFHLMNHSDAQVREIIQEFESLGVEKCGATHCIGDTAIGLFKEAYGENYIPMGVGRVLQVSY
ncbi:MBL fold metallo-hydrolase [bacterium]|nr:MBL fold metallo-hydrolase [bacterium]